MLRHVFDYEDRPIPRTYSLKGYRACKGVTVWIVFKYIMYAITAIMILMLALIFFMFFV